MSYFDPAPPYPEPAPPRKRSGRKAGIGLLVSLLVLIVLVVLADRGAAWAAEGQIAEQVSAKAEQQGITMSGEPEVDVEGFPFLTQVFAGEYQAITIAMREVSVGGVVVDTLEVRANTVRANLSDVMSGSGEVRADEVTGDATVPFSAVEELVGREGASVTGKDGKLLIRTPMEVANGQVKITVLATATVKVAEGALQVEVEDVSVVEGDLPSYAESALDNLASTLSQKVPLPKLPYGLALRDASVTDAGVVATASAKDVALAS